MTRRPSRSGDREPLMLRAKRSEVDETIERLGSRSRKRVDEARARLSIIGSRAVPALVDALEGSHNRVRAHVMPLLALIQDPRGREPLIAMLLAGYQKPNKLRSYREFRKGVRCRSVAAGALNPEIAKAMN